MSRKRAQDDLHGPVYERRSKAAREGRHLPSMRELAAGMPFYADAIDEDMAEFGERLLARLEKSVSPGCALERAIRTLTMAPEATDLREVAELLRSTDLPRRLDRSDCVLRCLFYAAAKGDPEAMRDMAAEIAYAAHEETFDDREVSIFCKGVLGWLVVAKSTALGTQFDDWPWKRLSNPRDAAERIGDRLILSIQVAFGWADPNAQPGSDSQGQPEAPPAETPGGAAAQPASGSRGQARQGSVVVIRSIGNQESGEGHRVLQAFKPYLAQAMPLVPTSDLTPVADQLRAAFPHAAGIIESVLAELAARPFVRIRPLVLDGPPGVGKTVFAERLFTALGAPSTTYACAGLSDGSLAGTARRWMSGEPCLALNVVLGSRCANPGIILDELEKAGTSRHNGNALDALLPFLEQKTAEQFYDPYLQAPVDLSHISWIATTNNAKALPAPLRDRCRILAFPEPTLDHLPVLAASLLREAARTRGLDERWAAPPSGEELDALAEVWPGGSVRRLQRLVEGLLSARDRLAEVQ